MRDFSTLHGSRRTLTLRKYNPEIGDICANTDVECLHAFGYHIEGIKCSVIRCDCASFAADTTKPPDEVVTIQEWHRPEDDALISDPDEIAELERRLARIGG